TFNAGPLATSKLTITTTDDDVRLNGAVTLNSDLTIDTGSAGAGDITFTNSATINSQGAEHNDLVLNAGTGSVFFNANIGAATATSSLGTMTVTTASGGVTFGQTDANSGAGGTGPVTTVNTDGAIDIGTVGNVISGGIVFNGGPLATSKLTITTTDDDVRLNGAVTLNSDLTIDTGSVGAGDITFTNSATINSQGAEHNDLVLNAGTGSVFFNANIGAATATSSLGTMTVTTASGGVTFGQTDANSGAGGTGPVTTVNTDGAIDIGTVGNVISGGIVFNGGPLATSKLTITTTDDDVRLNGAVTLNSDLTIDTGSVGAGDITFTNSATINSQGAEHNDLVLNAGTGSVFFNANIGAATRTPSLGTMTVTTASGGVTFGQTDANSGAGGTGPVTTVNTDGAIDIGTVGNVI